MIEPVIILRQPNLGPAVAAYDVQVQKFAGKSYTVSVEVTLTHGDASGMMQAAKALLTSALANAWGAGVLEHVEGNKYQWKTS